MKDSAITLALRELVETTDRRDNAARELNAATRSPDPRMPPKSPSLAPAQAQAMLLASLQHAAALAHARNVLATADDHCDEVARMSRAINEQRVVGYERRKDCPANQHTLSALTLESFTRHPTTDELQVWISDTSGPETRLYRMVQAVRGGE